MSTITRTWLAFAAFGAGLIHLALVVSSPLPVAIVLAALGIAECGWGVMTLLRDQLFVPRLALVGATAPIVLWSLVVVAASISGDAVLASALGVFPLTVATVFELFIAAVLAVQLRKKSAEPRPAPSAWRYLLGVVIGGAAVAMLTTPALAATEAGQYAQPHGEHSETFEPAEPGELHLPDHGESHP